MINTEKMKQMKQSLLILEDTKSWAIQEKHILHNKWFSSK